MMLDDSTLWRPKPQTPYRPTKRVTRASSSVLTGTLQALRSAGRHEAACLWLGKFDAAGDGIVEAVVIPKQINRPRNYSIGAEAMQEVAVIARPRKWTLVAAVHSHPGLSVEHSQYDDHMTPSHSALSIVFADYGCWPGTWPSSVGVHEYIDDYWHLLPPEDAAKRIVFTQDISIQCWDLR